MAYMSSTTTSPNVPSLVTQAITSSVKPRRWDWQSTHISSDVEAAGFITDAQTLGLEVGDLVIHSGSTTYIATSHAVLAVTSTGADLSVGTTVGLGA